MRGRLNSTEFKQWLKDHPTQSESEKRDSSFPERKLKLPSADDANKRRKTPTRAVVTRNDDMDWVAKHVAPAAFISSWYGGNKTAIDEDKDQIADQLTFLSVFAAPNDWKNKVIILAKRVKNGACDYQLKC